MDLAREYGPIYLLQVLGGDVMIVGSQELVNELCDESRFDKMLNRPPQQG
jgi:cytochrome P450/NADPH-cytochrome P450 reductase